MSTEYENKRICYAMMSCDLGSEMETIRQIKKMGGVEEVQGTFGAYDIVVKMTAEDMNAFRSYKRQMERITHIRNLLMLPVMDYDDKKA